MIGAADLWKAINVAWDASSLDASFKAYWDDPTETEFPVLHETEAEGKQPFPYCVMTVENGTVQTRMSQEAGVKRHIRAYPVEFHVHAREIATETGGAKEVAADLAEEIMKVFGGHPSQSPTGTLTLDNGAHLLTQYESEFSVREDNDRYKWIMNYLVYVDIPVAV